MGKKNETNFLSKRIFQISSILNFIEMPKIQYKLWIYCRSFTYCLNILLQLSCAHVFFDDFNLFMNICSGHDLGMISLTVAMERSLIERSKVLRPQVVFVWEIESFKCLKQKKNYVFTCQVVEQMDKISKITLSRFKYLLSFWLLKEIKINSIIRLKHSVFSHFHEGPV